MADVKQEVKMECDLVTYDETEQKPSAIDKAMEGHVHLGDAGLEDEDEEMDEEIDESEGDEVESIEDIKLQNGIFKYRVRWVGCKPSEDTWEPEESFTGSESKALLKEFRAAHKEKVEELLKTDKVRKSRRAKRGPRWEYVSEIVTREDNSGFKPRELQADDVFYGQPAGELAAAPSELKKLFDPTHKNTATELFLTTTDPSVKVTRSQTKALIGSRDTSRSTTPIPTKLLTAEDTSRGSASPTPQPAGKGRQRRAKQTTQRASKRKAAASKEDVDAVETIVIASSSVTETKVDPNSSDKPPIVLKLTLKKADKPAKKEKRSSSERTPKERKKREKKTSQATLLTPPSPKTKELEPQPSKEAKDGKDEMEVDQSPSQSETKTDTAAADVADAVKSSPARDDNNSKPAVQNKGRRRAVHLLPGPISINEPLTSQVLNNMLRELEIKHYGDEEKHPYSQEQFNEAVLSGNFMRVRKAMVNNLLTAPRLALWTNSYGANLLHLVCRNTRCDEKHAGDDIATVLCNIAPSLLSQRDNFGKIPLHDAVDRGQVCRVTRLLAYHSPVNVTDRNGNTPLSLAYSKNHAKMVKVLLQGGASFHALESSERRKPENLRKRRAYDVLTKHSRIVSSVVLRARRKVYRLLTEVRPASPCFIAPFCDGPDFTFNFFHTPTPFPDGGQYAYFLFLHVCSVKPEGGTWQARCWGGLRLGQAPTLNGHSLDPTSFTDRGDHMIFSITPMNGANTVQIRICDSEM